MTTGSGARRRSGMGIPVGGIVLITAGVIALLNTVGALNWSVWLDIWRLWPLLLVLWGLNVIFHRFHPLVIAVIVAASVGGAVGFAFMADDGDLFRGDLASFVYSTDRDDVTSLDLDISFGAGTLNVGALDPSDTRAVHVRFFDDVEHVSYEEDVSGDTVSVSVEADGGFGWLPWDDNGDREWTVLIHPDLLADLSVNAGAGGLTLDLSSTQVTEFDLNIGASDLDVTVPSGAGHVHGTIDAGASGIHVRVPEGVAARIDNDSGVSSVNIDEDRFPESDDIHISPGYDTATNRLDLSIHAGASGITVE